MNPSLNKLAGPARAAALPPSRPLDGRSLWSEDDGMLVLDARGIVTYCSSAAADITGQRPAAVMGQPVTRLLPDLPFRTNMPEFNLAFVASGGRGSWSSRPLCRCDGRRIWVEVFPGGIDGIDERSIVVIVKRGHSVHYPLAVPTRSTPETSDIGA